MLFYVLILLIVLFYVLFVCKCVLYYCHQVSIHLKLNIDHITSYHNFLGRWTAHSQRKFIMPHSMNCLLVIFVWSQKITPRYHILFHYIRCFLSTPCCTLESSSTLAKYCEVVQLKLSTAFPHPSAPDKHISNTHLFKKH